MEEARRELHKKSLVKQRNVKALEALADADADGAAPAPAAAEIFFRVIKSTPANSKTVKVALGAGQKVQSDFVAVTRHKRVMGYERILVTLPRTHHR